MVVTARVIEKLKNKDEQTFDQIYYEYNDLIYYICYSFTHDKSVSEDLMQETFIKMLSSLDSYKENGKFKQFITEIARNLSKNYVTRVMNKEISSKEELPLEDIVSSNDSDSSKMILELQGILTAEESDIVILKIVYDYKFKEIADYKNQTIGEIQAKYYKAINKVKENYKKGGISLWKISKRN